MRILMLCDLLPVNRAGGSERFVIELSRALAARGHRVACCGARLVPGNWPPGLYHARVGAALHGALRRTLRAFRPDLLHAHHPVATRIGARSGLPLVRTVHGAWREELARRRPLLARLAPRLLDAPAGPLAVASPALQQALPGAVLIPPGVDTERFRPAARAPGDPPVVGTVSRLAAERGIERFIALAAELRGRARFRVAGDGPLARRLRARARAARAPIEWCGPLDDVAGFLQGLDLYVNPSTTESFGLAQLEAMACGLPVVAAPSAGARGLLADGGGIVSSALSAAALELLGQPERRTALGQAARRRAEGYCWGHAAAEYERLYARACSDRAH